MSLPTTSLGTMSLSTPPRTELAHFPWPIFLGLFSLACFLE